MTATCVCFSRTSATEIRLPYRPPARAWAGHGSGRDCHLCQRAIDAHQIEYEVELREGPQSLVLYLHVDCYHRWAAVRE